MLLDAEILAPLGALAAVIGTAAGRKLSKYKDSAWRRDAVAARADLDEYQTQSQARIDRLQARTAELETARDEADTRAARANDELSAYRASCDTCDHRANCPRRRDDDGRTAS